MNLSSVAVIHGAFMPKEVEENVLAKKIFDWIVFVHPNWVAQ